MRFLSFVDRYILLKRLRKKTNYKVFDTMFSNEVFSSVLFKSIYLPLAFINLKEAELLLKREEQKIQRPFTPKSKGIDIVIDVLNNLLFTPKTIPESRKGLFSKLHPRHLIDAWAYYNEREKESVVNKLKKEKILKETVDTQQAIQTIDEVYESLKAYHSAEEFIDRNLSLYKKFESLFNLDNSFCIGDGHSSYSDYFNNPDWNLVREVRRIIKHLKKPVVLEERTEAFIGKKLNRRFILDDACVKPFEYKKERKQINTPKVGIIIDFSGSMEGKPEIRAKTLATAFLQERIANEILVKNEYFEDIVKTVEQLRSKPATGDERFDTLKSKEYVKDKDIILIITDLNIDEKEAKGLYRFIKEKEKNVIILCVNPKYFDAHKKELPLRRYDFSKKEDLITVAKKLTKNVS